MHRLVKITHLEQLEDLRDCSGATFDASALLYHAPDEHWVVAREEEITARCSLWWNRTAHFGGKKTGVVGHYAARDDAAAQKILGHVCERLRMNGCTQAVGPMNGNTWREYRFVTESFATERGDEPPFFLEPAHPRSWPRHFQDAGFTARAHYTSAINDDLEHVDPRIERAQVRMTDSNTRIREFRSQLWREEMQRALGVALIAFQNAFLFSPISETEFLAQYSALQPYIRPELILFAERDEQIVGFCLTVPDWLQAQRGRTIDTVIIKTVAVLPGRAQAGLGNLLVSQTQRVAHELGYLRAIHALMHDDNASLNLSRRYARPLRGYTLFSRPL